MIIWLWFVMFMFMKKSITTWWWCTFKSINALHFVALYFVALHYISLHFIAFHFKVQVNHGKPITIMIHKNVFTKTSSWKLKDSVIVHELMNIVYVFKDDETIKRGSRSKAQWIGWWFCFRVSASTDFNVRKNVFSMLIIFVSCIYNLS